MAHDMWYWAGGNEKYKTQSDKELGQCIAKATSKTFGELVTQGVTIGGSSILPTTWRWGFGRDNLQGSIPLSSAQTESVIAHIHTIDAEFKLISSKNELSIEQISYLKDQLVRFIQHFSP